MPNESFVEIHEQPTRRKRRGPVIEIRYEVEVRATESGHAAKPVQVMRVWGGSVPCTVLHAFREWTAPSRNEAVALARAEVKGWLAEGAPGST